jgi:hypothetical protein
MTMLFRSLFQRLAPRVRLRPRTCDLAVEALEDRLTPTATFSIGDVTVVEGNTGTVNAQVPVRLFGSHGNRVTVEYRTTPGTATAGSDYSAVTGQLTFNKNQTSRSIVVPIQGDRLPEANETFSVQLFNPSGATIADDTGVVTIQDNEPHVRISAPSLREGDAGTATMTFTVTLQAAYDLPVTVNYATGGGTATPGDDYVPTSGTVVIQPGQTYQTFQVAVNGDRLLETNETIQVNLTTPNSYATINNGGVGVGTILDNEPHISISGTSTSFSVTLEVPYDQVVTVDFTTLDGTAIADVDYAPTSGTLTFNPGETTQVINIWAYSTDDLYFYVQLSNPSANAAIVNDLAVGYLYYDPWW